MTAISLPADPTLEEIRAGLAPAIAAAAAFDGFTPLAVANAARDAGVDPDVAQLAYPGGAADMVDAWFVHVDGAMLERLPAATLATMKIRDRITGLVEARLDILAPHRESLRRALGVLALPTNVAFGLRLGWRAADAMWAAAGDTATDFNHYSKRAILGSVYAATMAVFLNDESDGHAETRAFLARRIAGVMQFESWKHRRNAAKVERPSLSRFIGRLRYSGK
jgi:ubiquinone biosynthesis protein COQ9